MGWEVVQKIENPNGTSNDNFGPSSISGNYAVVGAPFDDDAGADAGAAYFYQRDSEGNWNLIKKHTGEAASDTFGGSVSISGNYAVVGAPFDDDAGNNAGAAYFYQRDIDGNWNLVKKHTGEAANDRFGGSVSISGNYAVVGFRAGGGAGGGAGAVYFYQRDSNGHWNLVKKHTGEANNDKFGTSVSISGNYAVVGADGNDDAGADAGAAYFYQRDSEGNWNLIKKHTGEAASDTFGGSVSISGNYAVVGATGHDGLKGAAYFYQRDSEGHWNLVKKHTGETASDRFGSTVSISGNYAGVGASLHDGNKGAVYFYQRDGNGNWNLVKKFKGEAGGDILGSVSISGNYAFSGANSASPEYVKFIQYKV